MDQEPHSEIAVQCTEGLHEEMSKICDGDGTMEVPVPQKKMQKTASESE